MKRPPRGLRESGRRLWASVLTDFDLDEHELALLRQACCVCDTCDDLQAIVAVDGPIVRTSEGTPRTHPAVVELRQQRITLARLVVALRVPLGDETDSKQGAPRLQRRGIRGVYGAAS